MKHRGRDEAGGFEWKGRRDRQETGDTRRWHDVIRPFRPEASPGVAVIGFASDEGVGRNMGRRGAADGPDALRGALANLPLHDTTPRYDAGDVQCGDGDLERAQSRLAQRVSEVVRHGSFPIVLGGGHEVAWGTFRGLAEARPRAERILIVNIDAHFDLRAEARCSSGTPFLQIHDWCVANQRPFLYHVLGVSAYANTPALFERARRTNTRWVDDRSLQSVSDAEEVVTMLEERIAACDAVYLTCCLDALPADVAPGVSAPSALGVPTAIVEFIIEGVMESEKVAAMDVAECNPTYDIDGRTARVGARLIEAASRRLRL